MFLQCLACSFCCNVFNLFAAKFRMIPFDWDLKLSDLVCMLLFACAWAHLLWMLVSWVWSIFSNIYTDQLHKFVSFLASSSYIWKLYVLLRSLQTLPVCFLLFQNSFDTIILHNNVVAPVFFNNISFQSNFIISRFSAIRRIESSQIQFTKICVHNERILKHHFVHVWSNYSIT